MGQYVNLGGAWATAGNWSPSGPPGASGDTAQFDGRMTAAIPGSDASGTVLASLIHYASAAYNIGSASAALQVGATIARLGLPSPDGTFAMAEVALDFGTNKATVDVYASAGVGTSGLEPILLAGTHADNALTVRDGTVGIGTRTPGQASTFACTLAGLKAKLVTGTNCTLGTMTVSEGEAILHSAPTTLTTEQGSSTTIRTTTGTITTANIDGELTIESACTITTLNVETHGTVHVEAAATFTTTNVYGDGRILDPRGLATFGTNGVSLLKGARASRQDFGTEKTLTIA
jgi:hypothetical protein